MTMDQDKEVKGAVGNIKYTVDRSIIHRMFVEHNVNHLAEIEEALEKVKQHEDKSTQG